jgi:tetratricopeptide (TPR) repeat protein
MSLLPISSTGIFAILGGKQAQMSALAQTALARGADRALKGDDDGAIVSFQHAIGLDPSSDNAVTALDLLAAVYHQQGTPDEAVKAYRRAISLSPASPDPHLRLGNMYYSQDRYDDAEKEYQAALRLDPTSSATLLSVGQAAMAAGRYQEAESRFQQVISRDRSHYGGYYALGQAYSKQGRTEEAIAEFQQVISLKRDLSSVHVDLGSAYADLGQMDKAQEQLDILHDKAPELASILSSYIDFVTAPKFLAAYTQSGFNSTDGPGTAVSSLDPSLAAANASKLFDMKFVFSKAMDARSVQNSANWSISRAPASSPGGGYNWGQALPSTEVQISPVPFTVVYDAESQTAMVSFLVTQNASANGTIDPSHLVFRFDGKDVYGNTMDRSADEYCGISIIA